MTGDKLNLIFIRRIFAVIIVVSIFILLTQHDATAQADKPEADGVNSVHSATGGLPQHSDYPDTNRQKKCGELDSVMYNYLFIIVKKDFDKFLSFFSTEKTFKFTTYISGKKKKPAASLEIKFKKLEFDINNRIGLYDDFFEYDPDDYNYRSSIVESPFEKWKRLDNSYKIEDDWNVYYVKWICEGDKWVIEEVSYTQPY